MLAIGFCFCTITDPIKFFRSYTKFDNSVREHMSFASCYKRNVEENLELELEPSRLFHIVLASSSTRTPTNFFCSVCAITLYPSFI